MLSQDRAAYRFDLKTEELKVITADDPDISSPASQLLVRPSGKVWALSEQNGCICITDSTFAVDRFENNRLAGKR